VNPIKTPLNDECLPYTSWRTKRYVNGTFVVFFRIIILTRAIITDLLQIRYIEILNVC